MLFQGVAVEFYTQAHRHHSPLHVFHPHGATRSGLSRCIHGDRLPSTGLLEIVVSTLRSSPQYSRTWSYAARALRHPHCSNHELHSPTRHEVVALESIMSKGVRFCQLVFQTDRKHGRPRPGNGRRNSYPPQSPQQRPGGRHQLGSLELMQTVPGCGQQQIGTLVKSQRKGSRSYSLGHSIFPGHHVR